ncbi:MAG: hypothetical protein RLZZ371_354 [Pseudomonadota bacterium]
MRKTSLSLIAAFVVSALTTFAPLNASAREGAQSIGHGIKCYTAYLQNADGTYSWQRVCYKGV